MSDKVDFCVAIGIPEIDGEDIIRNIDFTIYLTTQPITRPRA